MRVRLLALLVCLLFALPLWATATPVPAASGCQFLSPGAGPPAFCDTLAQPSAGGTRSGQLDGTVWGVSRTNFDNSGQGAFDRWWQSQQQRCGATVAVLPPDDIAICNGMMVESVSDGGNVSNLSMYPRQPFDFAGRTGTVVFDVSDDTQGAHMAWPGFQITDQPVPTPHHDVNDHQDALPRNSVGLQLANLCNANCGPDHAASLTGPCVSVQALWQTSSYVLSQLPFQTEGCMLEPSGPGVNNHVEVQISVNQIKVFGTDAGTAAPLHLLAEADNLTLPLTRGLIWIQDVHYNGNKFGTQGDHTFTWANVGFDGPALPRDLGYDFPDSMVSGPPGTVNLGYPVPAGAQGITFTFPNVTGSANASGGLLVFNFGAPYTPESLNYAVNGHPAHTYMWPYGSIPVGGLFQEGALPIPASELADGTDTVQLTVPNSSIDVANVDLILIGAGGMPGATPTATAAAPTATPTAVPPTATPTPGATAIPTPTGTPAQVGFTLACTETGGDPKTISCKGA